MCALRTGRGWSPSSRACAERTARARDHRASGSGRGPRRGQDQGAHRAVRVRGEDPDVQRPLGRRRHGALRRHDALRPVLRRGGRRDPDDQRRARALVPHPRADHHHAADLRDDLPHLDPHPDLPPLPHASPLHQERERRRPGSCCRVDRDHRVRLPELRDRHLPRQQPQSDRFRVRRRRHRHRPRGWATDDRLAPAGDRSGGDRLRVLRRFHARALPRPAEGPRRHRLEPVPRTRRHARHPASGRGDVHHPVHDLRRHPRIHRRRQVLRRRRVRADRPAPHGRGADRDDRVIPARHRLGIGGSDDGHARLDHVPDAETRRA